MMYLIDLLGFVIDRVIIDWTPFIIYLFISKTEHYLQFENGYHGLTYRNLAVSVDSQLLSILQSKIW